MGGSTGYDHEPQEAVPGLTRRRVIGEAATWSKARSQGKVADTQILAVIEDCTRDYLCLVADTNLSGARGARNPMFGSLRDARRKLPLWHYADSTVRAYSSLANQALLKRASRLSNAIRVSKPPIMAMNISSELHRVAQTQAVAFVVACADAVKVGRCGKVPANRNLVVDPQLDPASTPLVVGGQGGGVPTAAGM